MEINKYNNGKIYKLICNTTNLIYYGSTTQKLSSRLAQHRNNNLTKSKEIIENNNYIIELVENYSCNSKKELEERERFYIENNECINKTIPTQSKKEWKEKNKEHLLDYRKEWKEKNKEHLLDYYRTWKQNNKEKLLDYNRTWKQNNKQHIKELNEKNIEKIREQNRERNRRYRERKKLSIV
jgi:hypothetical protein